ncbi:MAG: zinc-binding alcohol dehydrogenase family protein, partial [Woeseia sp.]|nr:zinc-binding alcohol dehydrogenase family protein [Woeseia sp.]
MKAIGYKNAGPISAQDALIEFDTEVAQPGASDLLVEVRGISVNPVDVKVRAMMQPEGGPRILGFDAAGVVKAVGSDVTRFKP